MIKYLLLALLLIPTSHLHAQGPFLDPTRNLPPSSEAPHTPLPEQYLWTAGDVTAQRADRSKFSWSRQSLRIDPHFFRTTLDVTFRPSAATMYVAGPRSARVWINGRLAATFTSDIDAPIGFHVFHA